MTEKDRFLDVCRYVAKTDHCRKGIGTLGEKTVHYALKIFFEEREEFREVTIGRYVADIKNESGIIEIQTSGFGAFKHKLEEYLFTYDVNIVYPVTEKKHVIRISRETGEIVKEYNSPRHVRPAEIFKELLYLGDVMYSPRLSFTLVSLAVDEMSYAETEGRRKRGVSYKIDKYPKELLGIQHYGSVYEMGDMFIFEDGEILTGDKIRKYLNAKGRSGSAAVKVMENIGYLERIGKEGRKVLYKFIKYPRIAVE